MDLLKGSTSIKEVKRIANNTYGDKALKMRAIYKILNQIKTGKNFDNKRKFNSRRPSALPLSSPLLLPLWKQTARFA